MALFGVPQEQHDQLAAQLKAVSSQLAQAQRENQEARQNWGAWERKAKGYEAQAKETGKRAEAFEKENAQLHATISGLAKAAEGWHNFGGTEWFWLDSIVRLTTRKDNVVHGDYSSPEVVSVEYINGEKPGYPYPTLDEVLAILEARRKGRRGGGGTGTGGGGGDLPDAPMPRFKPTPPTPGFSR
jgi:hypothetical protein